MASLRKGCGSVEEFEAVKVSLSPTDKFGEYLASRGKKFTEERRIIVGEVFASHEHFEAASLVTKLEGRQDGCRVSRSTVQYEVVVVYNDGTPSRTVGPFAIEAASRSTGRRTRR